MSKGNHTTAKIIKITPLRGQRIFSISLKISEWKKMFPEPRFKWIIAEALNEWIEITHAEFNEHESNPFYLVGYLITSRRLCLVLKIKKSNIDKELHHFYDILKTIIIKNLGEANLDFESSFSKEENAHETNASYNLFDKIGEPNHYLTQLIIGRQVKLPYYNPHLVRLEDSVHNYNFCSAIDYSGAKGPVNVTLLSKEEFFVLEKIKE